MCRHKEQETNEERVEHVGWYRHNTEIALKPKWLRNHVGELFFLLPSWCPHVSSLQVPEPTVPVLRKITVQTQLWNPTREIDTQ